jgi:hypothetical protein
MADLLHLGRRLLERLRKRAQYRLVFMSDTQQIAKSVNQHGSATAMSFREIMSVIARPAIVDLPAIKPGNQSVTKTPEKISSNTNKPSTK